MIAYLKGKLLFISPDSVILAVQGVGYEVFLPTRILSQLEQGQDVELFTHTVVREDVLDLYGFLSWQERSTFATLLSIPKIGPKLGLAILNKFTPEDLAQIVFREDVSRLASVPGIGAKTAKKIFLDLKDKLKISNVEDRFASIESGDKGSILTDTLEALKGLGYTEEEVLPLIKEVLAQDESLDVSLLIREVLKKKANLKT
ncbi:Holliday junction branch migration protein RuvA [Desulfonauticus submarinus]